MKTLYDEICGCDGEKLLTYEAMQEGFLYFDELLEYKEDLGIEIFITSILGAQRCKE